MVIKNFLGGLLILLISPIVVAEVASKNLSTLQTQISNAQQDLKQQQINRTQLQQTLQQVETELGTATQHYQQTATEQKIQQASLQKLKQQQLEYEKTLILQKEQLALQIRSAYMLGQKQYWQLLLNQEDPSRISRNLTYYRYLTHSQLKVIEGFRALLQQVSDNKDAIAQHTAGLAVLQTQQQQQLAEIKSRQAQRAQSLKQLSGVIQTKDEQLRQLLANRAALERVIQKMAARQLTVGGEIAWPAGGSFAKAQGQLSWPTRGRILAGFNTPIEQSEIKLGGVLLGAAEGQGVYAIAPGRVVFADWMAGYGLLMIVDHGQGYMTLYGRNGSLFKQIGQMVKPGERLASVGNSGGYEQPSLYFAIRKQGTALNPQLWCR